MNVIIAFILSFALSGKEVAPTPVDESHLVIYGNTVEMIYGSENEANAPGTRVIVYKENEIYTAFKSNDKGEYVFNLPLGERYELSFGGDHFVNKRFVLDLRRFVDGKKVKRDVAMDVSLFRPVEKIDYTPMEKPVVTWYFDKGAKEMVPDMDSAMDMLKTVDKVYRKSEKAALKAK